jgi:hypothetical protein
LPFQGKIRALSFQGKIRALPFQGKIRALSFQGMGLTIVESQTDLPRSNDTIIG